MKKSRSQKEEGRIAPSAPGGYDGLVRQVSGLLEQARRASARSVNAIMTATYWMVGRHIVEFEQGGALRAEYGELLLERLSGDLTQRFGRGFGTVNLSQMRKFHLSWPIEKIFQTPSENSVSASLKGDCDIMQTVSALSVALSSPAKAEIPPTPSAESVLRSIAVCFPLPWSAYVRLLSVKIRQTRKQVDWIIREHRAAYTTSRKGNGSAKEAY